MSQIRTLHRSEHNISRKNISPHALKVLYRLRSKGFWAFLVGGALRDLLRDREPRDFDVATNASIAEIKALFRNSKMIGKRFPIVHTYFGSDLVEVSCLKADGDKDKYETLLADALLRDFTVNSIFYDINDFRVVDPLGAVDHVERGLVVPIGDMNLKFEEDPIRMLRALKLVVKQGFSLAEGVEKAIRSNVAGWQDVGPGRRYEEITRILLSDEASELLALCKEMTLLQEMWPQGFEIMENFGPNFFSDVNQGFPIHYSRGSFAKHSHTHLWFQLFMKSNRFSPVDSLPEARAAFDHFLGPLGMPFRQPVADAIFGISLIKKGDKEPLTAISRESRQLIEKYAEKYDPELARQLPSDMGRKRKPKDRPKRKRRRRRNRNKGMAREK